MLEGSILDTFSIKIICLSPQVCNKKKTTRANSTDWSISPTFVMCAKGKWRRCVPYKICVRLDLFVINVVKAFVKLLMKIQKPKIWQGWLQLLRVPEKWWKKLNKIKRNFVRMQVRVGVWWMSLSLKVIHRSMVMRRWMIWTNKLTLLRIKEIWKKGDSPRGIDLLESPVREKIREILIYKATNMEGRWPLKHNQVPWVGKSLMLIGLPKWL